MNNDPFIEPNFFEGRRLSTYFKGGRLMKDKKTDQRFWRFKWALTLEAGDAYAAKGAIEANYLHLRERKNSSELIELGGCLGGLITNVFDTSASDAPSVLRLDRCFIDKFKMTWSEGLIEFWIQLEHPLTDQLHNFVKNYAFQRFFVDLQPAQKTLAEGVKEAAENMQKLAEEDNATISLHHAGKKLAEFKPKGGKPN